MLYSVCSIQCEVFSVQYLQYSLCSLNTSQQILHTEYCTHVQYLLCNIHCTVFIVQYSVCRIHCAIFSVSRDKGDNGLSWPGRRDEHGVRGEGGEKGKENETDERS